MIALYRAISIICSRVATTLVVVTYAGSAACQTGEAPKEWLLLAWLDKPKPAFVAFAKSQGAAEPDCWVSDDPKWQIMTPDLKSKEIAFSACELDVDPGLTGINKAKLVIAFLRDQPYAAFLKIQSIIGPNVTYESGMFDRMIGQLSRSLATPAKLKVYNGGSYSKYTYAWKLNPHEVRGYYRDAALIFELAKGNDKVPSRLKWAKLNIFLEGEGIGARLAAGYTHRREPVHVAGEESIPLRPAKR